jgi:hypothetical protein
MEGEQLVELLGPVRGVREAAFRRKRRCCPTMSFVILAKYKAPHAHLPHPVAKYDDAAVAVLLGAPSTSQENARNPSSRASSPSRRGVICLPKPFTR